MKHYNNYVVDNWKAEERYFVAYNTLKDSKDNYSFDLVKDILSGKYGFMCQYDRKTDAGASIDIGTQNFTHMI